MPRQAFQLDLHQDQFVKSSDYSNLQFGFELETQSFLGCTMNNLTDIYRHYEQHGVTDESLKEQITHSKLEAALDDPDFFRTMLIRNQPYYSIRKAMQDATEEYIMSASLSDHPFESVLTHVWMRHLHRKGLFNESVRSRVVNSWAELAADQTYTLNEIFDKTTIFEEEVLLRRTARTIVTKQLDRKDFKFLDKNALLPLVSWNPDLFFSSMAGKNWDPLLGFCGDGSVSGPEIKPVRPLTFEETEHAVYTVFKNEMVVDTRCSFHVHVSIRNSPAQYDEKIQLYMTEFLLANLNHIPESCKIRWKNKGQFGRYFPIHPSREKYSFINFHSRFNSWEFRCFGNISNTHDAIACIKLAAEAYRYALRRKAKSAKGLVFGSAGSRKSFWFLKQTLRACLDNEAQLTHPKMEYQKAQEAFDKSQLRFNLSMLRNSNRRDVDEESARYERFEQSFEKAVENVNRILSSAS